ncbi:MAG: hypothetical protein AB7I59_22965 [Geminicoccaceae bacterium]
MRGRTLSWALTGALALSALTPGAGAGAGELDDDFVARLLPPSGSEHIFSNALVAKAQPDECFDGIGVDYPTPNPDGSCPQGQPKVNQAYVWGLTQGGSELWFGTAPNVHCLVVGGFLGGTTPQETRSWTCEFGQSEIARDNPLLPAAIGDWRPPKAYSYNLRTKQLTNRTPTAGPAALLFRATLGIRSAGSRGGVVFLAGPALNTSGGINFFAFSSATGALIDACSAPAFTNIRQWLVVGTQLYAGVGTASGGGVLRWTGSLANPFRRSAGAANERCGFTNAGDLPGDAAYLTAVGTDRIAVSAWPTSLAGGSGAGVYLSPPFGANRALDPSDGAWARLWQPRDYDPDVVTSLTYAGGAIAYWRGALYFGTMHVPGLSAVFHASPACKASPIGDDCYGPPSSTLSALELFLGSYRAISVWRINSPTSGPSAELLYGESKLPAYDPGIGHFVPESTGFTPTFGPSGFGNYFNNYTWSAAVFGGQLVFGTMDWSYLLAGAIPGVPDEIAEWFARSPGKFGFGADLIRFWSPNAPAVTVNATGLGNYLNYGLRSFLVTQDGRGLFVGTANPMNLEAKGGWELRRLAKKN